MSIQVVKRHVDSAIMGMKLP